MSSITKSSAQLSNSNREERVGRRRKRKRKDDENRKDESDNKGASTIASFPPLSQIASKIQPNFAELSASYPNFAQQWKKIRQRQNVSDQGRGGGISAHVDFDFNFALSSAILNKHFNINLKCMPKGYLCPPIPNRFNYVMWIRQLLEEISPAVTPTSHDETRVHTSSASTPNNYFQKSQKLIHRGLDLGVGVSCIYPLLLSSHEFTRGQPWHFFGTDIDPYSIKCAKENIDVNNLQDVIKLALVIPRASIDRSIIHETTSLPHGAEENKQDARTLDLEIDEKDVTTPLTTAMEAASRIYHDENEAMFDFCMSNPPFYSNADDATIPRRGDGRDRTEMTLNESVYPGGEMGFALDMLHDSFFYREKITWYTLMFSKKSSLISFEKELSNIGLYRGSIRTTEFVQGKMIRWGVAWTYLSVSLRSPGKDFTVSLVQFSLNELSYRHLSFSFLP